MRGAQAAFEPKLWRLSLIEDSPYLSRVDLLSGECVFVGTHDGDSVLCVVRVGCAASSPWEIPVGVLSGGAERRGGVAAA